ncbi:glycosyltransferase family 4 protein [bacterium]|nr:glycosyltransferase family 4 protein [bacterium]
MKICYLCADPGIPIFGRKGCSTHVRETCSVLTELGNEVRLLCSNPAGDRDGAEGCGTLDTVAVEPPRSRKLGFDLRHVVLDYRFGKALERLIEEWRPDAIYERYSLYSRAGLHAARRHNLPRLLEVNAFLTREQQDRIRLAPLARMVERGIIRSAPRVIVVSEPLRKEVASLGVPINAVVRMPMAVNLEKFNPTIDGAEVRRRHGLEDRFVIGYVGTLAGWHGLKLLEEVAEKLRDGGAAPFAFMIVGGEGHKLDENRERVRGRGLGDLIRFIGSVPYEDVPRHIRAMDAAVVPDTTYWSSPAKLFEYQASGVPVLAPSYPAIHDALDHGREGFIFKPLDTGEMARLIMQMMGDREKLKAMSEAARRRAERDHSWRYNGERIMELFKEIR